jgi:beta-glucosidase
VGRLFGILAERTMRSFNSAFLSLSLVFTAGVGVHASMNTGAWHWDSGKIDKLIASLTPEEKISLLAGAWYAGSENYAGYLTGVPRLGIPPLQLADGES